MILSKVIFSGAFAISAFGLGSASYAVEMCRDAVLIDKMWVDGVEDCVAVTERQDNGWGNGDNDAPGGSLPNNNAENHNGDNTDGTVDGTITNSSGNTPPGKNK